MSHRRIELAARRGELKAKIEMQRTAIAQHARPVAELLSKADRVVDGVEWVKNHPTAVGAAVAAVAVARPKRTWKLIKRGFFLWQSWKTVRSRLRPLLGG